MKYLIALTLLISLASCKKCAECTTTVTTDVTGQTPVTSKSETQMCGDELKENDGYYNTATSTVQGHTATITTKTTCR